MVIRRPREDEKQSLTSNSPKRFLVELTFLRNIAFYRFFNKSLKLLLIHLLTLDHKQLFCCSPKCHFDSMVTLHVIAHFSITSRFCSHENHRDPVATSDRNIILSFTHRNH